jgi:hypothetical protein
VAGRERERPEFLGNPDPLHPPDHARHEQQQRTDSIIDARTASVMIPAIPLITSAVIG